MDITIIFGGLPSTQKKDIIEDKLDKIREIPKKKQIIGYDKYKKNNKTYNLQVWEVDFDKKDEERIKMLSKISHGCIILSNVTNAKNSDNRKKILKWKDMIKKESESVKRKIPFILLERKWDTDYHYTQSNQIYNFSREHGFIKGFKFSDSDSYYFNDAINQIIESIELKEEEESHDENEDSSYASVNDSFSSPKNFKDFTSSQGSLCLKIEDFEGENKKYSSQRYITIKNFYDIREKYDILKSLTKEEFIKLFETLQKENRIRYKLVKKNLYCQIGLPIYDLFGKEEEIILTFYNQSLLEGENDPYEKLIKGLNKMKKQLKKLKYEKEAKPHNETNKPCSKD